MNTISTITTITCLNTSKQTEHIDRDWETKDLYDRLILRSRLFCGSGSVVYGANTSPHNALSQCKLEVLSGTANPLCGLSVGDYGSASSGAVVQSATLVGNIGNSNQLTSGGGTTQGEAYVTFYDGTGTKGS